MEKEYISTIVIDSESAAKTWRDLPNSTQDDGNTDNSANEDEDGEFSGAHTWVS